MPSSVPDSGTGSDVDHHLSVAVVIDHHLSAAVAGAVAVIVAFLPGSEAGGAAGGPGRRDPPPGAAGRQGTVSQIGRAHV